VVNGFFGVKKAKGIDLNMACFRCI